MLDVILEWPAEFEPGEGWQYSNTNYLVLGLLIERVTDRPLFEQVRDRIVEPLGLQHTYFPAVGEMQLRGNHPRGYHIDDILKLRDITDLDPSFFWSAGAMIASPSELNRFMQALMRGELVNSTSLSEMQAGIAIDDELLPGGAYGLGLLSYPLSCGGTVWGHGGETPGTVTQNAIGPDGTAVTIAVTSAPWSITDSYDESSLLHYEMIVTDALNQTLCDQK